MRTRRGDDDLNPGMFEQRQAAGPRQTARPQQTTGPRQTVGYQGPGAGLDPKSLTPAAVLIGLVDREDGFTVLLTQRSASLRTHAGQISFPGGKIEDADASPIEAALRETWEEVGLTDDKIDVIGALDPYVTRTGFRINPVVAFLTPPFEIKPDPSEVAAVFEAPLTHLMAPGVRQRHHRKHEGVTRYFYAMPYKDHYIWGATAGMLVNLVDVLLDRVTQDPALDNS